MSKTSEVLTNIRWAKDADDNYCLIGPMADIVAAVANGTATVIKRETNVIDVDTATMVDVGGGMAVVWPTVRAKREAVVKPTIPTRPTAVTPQTKKKR